MWCGLWCAEGRVARKPERLGGHPALGCLFHANERLENAGEGKLVFPGFHRGVSRIPLVFPGWLSDAGEGGIPSEVYETPFFVPAGAGC
ncbi:MAG: hypothetical protein RLZZ399_3050, partial [Verrucomicrobiota bacterium]